MVQESKTERHRMNKREWEIIEKHTKKFCLLTRLPKKHKFHLTPDECECSFHNMIRELKKFANHKK